MYGNSLFLLHDMINKHNHFNIHNKEENVLFLILT